MLVFKIIIGIIGICFLLISIGINDTETAYDYLLYAIIMYLIIVLVYPIK